MIKNTSGFTLVEIIVGVSISLLLMMGVGVFLVSGIGTILHQKNILSQKEVSRDFLGDIEEIFGGNFEILSNSNTGFVVKTSHFQFGKPLIYDFSLTKNNGYCENDGDVETSIFKLNNYNPFKAQNGNYLGSYLTHEIFENGVKIIGKGMFGDNFEEEIEGNDMYLNTPGGIISLGSKVFFSDTGNNKIYFSSGGKIYSYLDEKYGLYQPTSLYRSGMTLYIANSGLGEIWKISSESGNSKDKKIDLNWIADKNFSFNKLKITSKNNFNISGSYNTGSFTFSGFIKNPGDSVSKVGNSLEYTFTGTQSIASGNTYGVKIPSFVGNFTSLGSAYIELTFDGYYKKIFPYISNGDNNLFTLQDNEIEVIYKDKNAYFGEISGEGGNILLKDFLRGEKVEIDIDGNFLSSGALNSHEIPEFEVREKIYDLKIKDFILKDDDNFITLKVEYYEYFDCYDEGKNIVKTLLLKKSKK